MRVIGSKLRRRSNKLSSFFEQLENRQLLSNTLIVGPGQTYATIQAAVNAVVPGTATTIQVAPGNYLGQVTIPAADTNLTIQAQNSQTSPSSISVPANSSVSAVNALFPDAANSSVIMAPASMTGNNAIVDDSASNFHLTGFVIEGPSLGIGFGVLVEGGATAVQIDHNHILHVHDAPALSGGQHGYGVVATGGSSATITQNFISDYQKSGIVIDGAGTVGTVSNDVVVGGGPVSVIAQNGIVFDNGASGSVSSSLVTGNIEAALTNEDGGILLSNSGQVSITGNVSYNNDGDIILDGPSNTAATSLTDYAHGSSVTGNETYGATYDGIDLFDGANSITIANNNSHNNGFDGLLIDGSSDGNLVTNNQFAQNNQDNVGEFDIEDDTFGQANPVVGNFGTGNFYSIPNTTISTNFPLPVSPPTTGIVVLDPNNNNALQDNGTGAKVNVPNGLVVVDSSGPQAVNVQSGATLSVGTLDVTGNVTKDNNSTITGTVKTGTTRVNDPLASLPAVTTAGLTTQSANQLQIPDNTTITLNPGVYVNGIRTGHNDKITLSPGIYYLQGGGFNIGDNTTVTGNGVLLYNAWNGGGDEIQTGNATNVTLSAPTTGTYAGVAIFEARSTNMAPMLDVHGGSQFNVTGTVYLPSGQFHVHDNGTVATITNPTSNGAPALVDTYDLHVENGGVLNVNGTSTGPSAPTVTVTSGNEVYTGNAYVPSATVTGSSGVDNSAFVTYTYFVGTGTGGTNLGAAAPITVGTYTVVAHFGGDSTYLAASSNPTTFQITPATPTVTVADAGGPFTGSPYPATATVTGVSGPPAASLEGVTPTLSYFNGTTATGPTLPGAPSAVGTYTVVAKFAGSADYAAANSAPVTFKITSVPTAPTVTVTSGNEVFTGNGYVPATTVTGSSGVDSGAVVTYTYYVGTGTGGTNLGAVAPTTVGTYTVVASFAGDSTYTAGSSAPKTFQITPATPTVIVSDAGGVFTGSPYPATATVTGVSGSPAASLESVTPTLTYYNGNTASGPGFTSAPSAVGVYTVVANFAGSADYTSAASGPVTFSITANTAPSVAMLLLDPTGNNALQIGGGGKISAPSESIEVNSSNSQAVNVGGGGNLTAKEIDVVGNIQNGSSVTGTVHTGVASFTDPLAGLAAPSVGVLQSSHQLNIPDNTTITLQPGEYIGGIKIGNHDNVTLAPGIYYLQGGGFQVGQSTVTGNGVMIYNTWQGGGDGININGGNVTLSAATTGTYAGIAIFQARANSQNGQTNGAPQVQLGGANASLTITGAIYAATAQINIGGGDTLNITRSPGSSIPDILASDLNDGGGMVLA